MHDFSFYRIQPVAIRYIGGFGKIHWIDMTHYAVAQAQIFAQHEELLLAEMSAGQQDLLQQLLQQQGGVDAQNVRAIGLNCDGIDVNSDEKIWRLNFSEAIAIPSLDCLASLKMGD